MRPRVVTAELEQSLSSLPDVLAHVRSALGSTGPLEPVGFPVLSYLLIPSQELFVTYLLTPARLAVCELARDGRHLTTVVPLTRIRRVVEAGAGPLLELRIEMDAGSGRLAGTVTDTTVTAELEPVSYLLTADSAADETAHASLLAFGVALRSATGV